MSVNKCIINKLESSAALSRTISRRGITLIELLAVVAIIGILVALLLPFSRSARPAALRAQCTNNLKQIGLAIQNYEQTHKALPPAFTVDANGRPLHSWRTLILPYLEKESHYQTIDLSKPWNDPVNAQALGNCPLVFQCPAAVEPGNKTTYLAIVGPNACFEPTKPRPLAEITDAHASTLMVIEAGEEHAVPWMAPADADEALLLSLGSNTKLHHAGGMNACMVDGGVRFLRAKTLEGERRAIMSISGGDDPIANE